MGFTTGRPNNDVVVVVQREILSIKGIELRLTRLSGMELAETRVVKSVAVLVAPRRQPSDFPDASARASDGDATSAVSGTGRGKGKLQARRKCSTLKLNCLGMGMTRVLLCAVFRVPCWSSPAGQTGQSARPAVFHLHWRHDVKQEIPHRE